MEPEDPAGKGGKGQRHSLTYNVSCSAHSLKAIVIHFLSWTLQPELMFLKAIKFELLYSLCISKIAFLSTIYQAQIVICLYYFLELNINFPPASSALPGWNVFDSKAFVTPGFLQKFLYVCLEPHLGVLSTA